MPAELNIAVGLRFVDRDENDVDSGIYYRRLRGDSLFAKNTRTSRTLTGVTKSQRCLPFE